MRMGNGVPQCISLNFECPPLENGFGGVSYRRNELVRECDCLNNYILHGKEFDTCPRVIFSTLIRFLKLYDCSKLEFKRGRIHIQNFSLN